MIKSNNVKGVKLWCEMSIFFNNNYFEADSYPCLEIDKSVILFTGFLEFGNLPSSRGGFYCKDPSLSYSFNGDTVNTGLILSTTMAIPLVMMLLSEVIMGYNNDCRINSLKMAMYQAVHWYKSYAYSFLFIFLLLEIIKCVYGEPRPHFLETCKPDAAEHCVSGYITNYTCTNTELSGYIVRDSIRSFVSGHSALSIFMGYFMFWYIARRCKKIEPGMLKFVLQSVFVVFPCFVCLTRLTDHRHHWWDVVAGVLIGFAASKYTVNTGCSNFEKRHEKSSPSEVSKLDSDIIVTSDSVELTCVQNGTAESRNQMNSSSEGFDSPV